jgi:amino acid permease
MFCVTAWSRGLLSQWNQLINFELVMGYTETEKLIFSSMKILVFTAFILVRVVFDKNGMKNMKFAVMKISRNLMCSRLRQLSSRSWSMVIWVLIQSNLMKRRMKV